MTSRSLTHTHNFLFNSLINYSKWENRCVFYFSFSSIFENHISRHKITACRIIRKCKVCYSATYTRKFDHIPSESLFKLKFVFSSRKRFADVIRLNQDCFCFCICHCYLFAHSLTYCSMFAFITSTCARFEIVATKNGKYAC